MDNYKKTNKITSRSDLQPRIRRQLRKGVALLRSRWGLGFRRETRSSRSKETRGRERRSEGRRSKDFQTTEISFGGRWCTDTGEEVGSNLVLKSCYTFSMKTLWKMYKLLMTLHLQLSYKEKDVLWMNNLLNFVACTFDNSKILPKLCITLRHKC